MKEHKPILVEGGTFKKRIVVVDDSHTMRKWLKFVLEKDVRLTVVGEAADALEAREIIRAVRPDVVTLDVCMPKMDGLDFLERLMRLFPLPVVMLSSEVSHDLEVRKRALALGAKDFVAKPRNATDSGFVEDFCNRVHRAASADVSDDLLPLKPLLKPSDKNMPLILLGASTGGVSALEVVLSDLDASGPPVVVVQHMPHRFLMNFVNRLDQALPQNVRLVDENTIARSGDILFAPSCGEHTQIDRVAGEWICRLCAEHGNALHVPSVDQLFSSAARFGRHVISAILTGLGQDGTQGMELLSREGAITIGQDQKTSAVYGMPRAAFESGAIQQQLPLHEIGDAINAASRQFQMGSRGSVLKK